MAAVNPTLQNINYFTAVKIFYGQILFYFVFDHLNKSFLIYIFLRFTITVGYNIFAITFYKVTKYTYVYIDELLTV